MNGWTQVCRYDRMLADRGVAALVPDLERGRVQVALVKLADGRVFCVGQRDPFSGANVMARGIVGSAGADPDTGEAIATITSPMFKHVFDLGTGKSLLDERVCLGSWQVRVDDGMVEVGTALRRPVAPRPVGTEPAAQPPGTELVDVTGTEGRR